MDSKAKMMKSRRTMLHHACERGGMDLIQIYIGQGLNVNACTQNRETPLIIACRKGHEKVVKLLLERGADINIKDSIIGRNALHMACTHNNDNVLRVLLNHNADVNVTTDVGNKTALHLAAERGNFQVAETLLQNGAQINAKNGYGLTPLHAACRNGYEKLVELFLLNGADIHDRATHICNTPILLAAEYGHENIFKLLLGYGANINDIDGLGFTALHLSAFSERSISLLKYLLTKIDVEAKDSEGRSPLQFIMCTKPQINLNIVELFLNEGADVNFLFRGNYPMIIIIINLHHEIADILTKYAIKIKAANVCKTEISLDLLLLGKQEYVDFYDSCLKEILELKNEGHFSTYVTFFHFVTADATKAGKYLTNPNIYEKLAATNITEKYPIYGEIIKKNFEEGRIKFIMTNLSLRYLNFVSHRDLPYLCRFKIITYLSEDDLINFKLACDPRRIITY